MNLNSVRLLIISLIFLSCQEKIRHMPKQIKKAEDTISEVDNSKKISERDTITIEYLYKDQPYDYDTTLIGGYNLAFAYFRNNENEIDMCLNLVKNGKIIDTLNVLPSGLPHKNLGYIGVDFKEYFAFVNSFGSGNPNEFKLIKKSNAKSIVSGFIVDHYKNPEILLYAKGYDSLMIYDISKKESNYIENLTESKEIDCLVSQLNEVLKIVNVTSNSVSIEIEQNSGKKIIKKYYR